MNERLIKASDAESRDVRVHYVHSLHTPLPPQFFLISKKSESNESILTYNNTLRRGRGASNKFIYMIRIINLRLFNALYT